MNHIAFLSGIALAAFLTAGTRVSAQLISTPPQPILGARLPAFSPDGRKVAFVYRGDLWIAPSSGGRATPLTTHVEQDGYPLFSPDGEWIAFSSRRTGNSDIFAVPVEGGLARQLTWHTGSDIPQGWSPDGKRLLFTGRRDAPHYAIYAFDVKTLRTQMLCEDYAQLAYPNFSPDGKQVVYGRYGFPWSRPRYSGSAAQQIWILDVAKNSRRALTTNEFQHLWTRFLPDGKHLVTVTVGEATPSSSSMSGNIGPFLDSEARTPNLWRFDLEGRGEQLTHFIGGGVRCPSVAAKSGDVVFEYGTDLFVLRKGAREPDRIPLLGAADEKQTTRKREKLTTGVTEAEISPDGKTFAFGLRGDIWTVRVEKPKGPGAKNAEFARRLTDWEGDDSDFFWSPDGSRVYFTSDREFTTRLYEMDLATMKSRPIWNRDENLSRVGVSPDGKQLGFWVSGKEGGLYVLPLEGGEARRIVKLPGPQWRGYGGGDFAWSPDMQWMAYSARSQSRAWNIFVVPLAGGEPVNVTRLYASHSKPAWSADGKFLYFQSDREGSGLYSLALTREIFRSFDSEMKFEKPGTNLNVVIEFEDISWRIRKLATQSPQGDLTATADGTLYFISEGDVFSVTYDGKETKRLTTGGGKQSLRVSKEAKKISYTQGGDMYTAGISGTGAEKVTFTAEWDRDVRNERKAAFTQFWNSYNRAFYDPNFHGRDWAAIRERYEPLLDGVETGDEFATLLQMMIGELEASHSEVQPATGGQTASVSPHFGFSFDYSHPGPGLKVKSVPPGVPASFKKSEIKPGEIVLAINGADVSLDERLYFHVNDKQDREFEFLVSTNGLKKGARTVRYKCMTAEEWAGLIYKNRIEHLRKYVEEKSRGKLGYVHLQAMGVGNQVKFEREAFEYMAGKEAMVIDVRFNAGGNIADTLIEWIERKPHGWIRPRDAEPESTPHRSWEKKCVVLMNEHSYSNGEIFPSAMRVRNLAKLVGMPTPGYVIWTSDLRLVDGTGARMPGGGSFRLDGTNLENNGEQPDVRVPMSPDDYLNDRDPQLDKAIELILGESPVKKPEVARQ